MSMLNCPECNKRVSEKVTSCPKCGYPFSQGECKKIVKKETNIRQFGCLFIIGIIFLIGYAISSIEIEPSKPKTKTRKEKIESLFSLYDGSHRKLEQHIKKIMNDPNSYEHIETRYSDKGKYILVSTKFRGNNAFGGKVVSQVWGEIDLKGNLIKIRK